MRGSSAVRDGGDSIHYGRARAQVGAAHLPLVALAHAATAAARGARGRAAAVSADRGDGKSVTIRGIAAERIGAVAWHGISDADTAGAAIDAQLTAIAKAVVRASGADESLLCHYYANDTPESPGAKLERLKAVMRGLGVSDPTGASASELPALKAALRAIGVPESVIEDYGKGEAATVEPDPEHFNSKKLDAREKIEQSPYAELWDSAVSPMLSEWRAWYADKKHWYNGVTELTEAWASYTGWAKRVNELRDTVERAGVHVGVPRMQSLPSSYKDKAEETAGDALSMAKIAIYGGLAIAGIAALALVARGGSVKDYVR